VKTTSESRRGPISCPRERENIEKKNKESVPFVLLEPQIVIDQRRDKQKGKEKKTKQRPIQDGRRERTKIKRQPSLVADQ